MTKKKAGRMEAVVDVIASIAIPLALAVFFALTGVLTRRVFSRDT